MEITLTAFDMQTKTEMVISVKCQIGHSVDISADSTILRHYDYTDFLDRLYIAQPNAGFGHLHPSESSLYKELQIRWDKSWYSVLLRSFIVTFKHLIAARPENDSEVSLRPLDNFACIENTGSLGPQPTLYFVSEQILQHAESVEWLFKHNFLCRFRMSLDTGLQKRTFFVPFEVPKHSRVIDLGLAYPTWTSIVRSYHAHVSTFARPEST